MCDGVCHPLLIRQGRVNFVGQTTIRPAELQAGDADRELNRSTSIVGLQIGGTPQDDVTFEHRQAIHVGIVQPLAEEGRAVDTRRSENRA